MSAVGTDPGVENRLIGAMKILRSRGPVRVLPDRTASEKKRNDDCARANRAHRRLLQLPSETKHDDSAEGRQQRNQQMWSRNSIQHSALRPSQQTANQHSAEIQNG